MQDTGATNPVSPMYGSTIDPMQSGGENCVEVNGQSSQQSEHEYINLDDETLATQDTNEDPVERDVGNNNGEHELELKRIYKTLPVIAPNAKYDANKMREAIANWLMVTEQPFSTVEDEMFIYMMKMANSLFERISRPTAKADCFNVYEHEKKKLKTLTNSLSNNWRLQKCVLSFMHVPPPRTALDIADGIYKCLKEWEIEGKIFSISVDNAAYNDKVVKTLKTNFSRVKKPPCEGRLFHVRCCAHILNFLVKEGLSKINDVIEEVREAVIYINYSEARRQIFSNVAHQLQIHDRKLMLDVPTRWNSTYDMLSPALNFKDVFPSHLPSDEDWDNVTAVCEVLKVFKVCINIISGSDYTTANLYLKEVYKVKQIIDKSALSRNEFICEMAEAIKEKFDKYLEECHLLMAIAAVLDPRMKMWYMHDELVREAASHKNRSFRGSTSSRSNEDLLGSEWEEFGNFYKDANVEKCDKSELKMYLDEGLLEGHWGMKFNALEWWNIHQLKYPVLSKMANDVLAIPVSTVASEATFSAGGRVIDPYRYALKSSTVEMLLCGGVWIRQNYGLKKKVKKEDIPTEVLLPVVKRS
ncbi:zinc finger BED domain-containing protein RICESLEEPER 2-like protein [Tanacetum coccineum]